MSLLLYMLITGFDIKPREIEGAYTLSHVSNEIGIGVKPGDWIKYNYTVTGVPSGITVPQWFKVEFLEVEGTKATVYVTMQRSDSTEQSESLTVDVATGNGTLDVFFGFIIPANSAPGDFIYISEYGRITIDGETSRIYAGESRTVVYATFYDARARYYWDKQTGVMVEASVSLGGITVTAKVLETNMWGVIPFWMQWWFWAAMATGVMIISGMVYLKRRKSANLHKPKTNFQKLKRLF